MKTTERQIVYWVGGNCLFSAEAVWWDGIGKGGYFKDAMTTEIVKDYGSTEEAEKEFRKIMETLGKNSKCAKER